ncbi:MAG: FGGY family carbohydrate kinase [Eubacteriales bacterium]|nr:FGGY family carbohydrate kinase [Eubacteriales bacterium]
MNRMGIDIGTTSISIVLLDTKTGKLMAKETVNHDSFLNASRTAACVHKHAAQWNANVRFTDTIPEGRIQDPEKIFITVVQKIEELIRNYGCPEGIGVTGQMHGMLYVDENGNAVSPLYTWQDGRGNLPLENGRTSVELLKDKLRNPGMLASGYGIVTHYYLGVKGEIPENAVKMTTISDYIVMKLCGRKSPVMGIDMAASWGGFDLEKKEFRYEELAQAGVDISYLPRVEKRHCLAGKTTGIENIPAGIPVALSIGDNQASFLGAVRELHDAVLINVGTGSQVSFASERYVPCEDNLELRPCTDDTYLLVGASLCGGRAYAMLEQFYREAAGNGDSSYYDVMYRQAGEFIKKYGAEAAWNVRTTFSGTRSNPKERGQISNISVENFYPGALTVGVMKGILQELYEQYQTMSRLTGKKAAYLVGSGNGLRRNPIMQKLAEEIFGLPLGIPEYQEEAACGAAYRLSDLNGLG